MTSVVKYVTDAGCQKQQTIACFLDVGKAFNKVCHEVLLFKFREIQLPDCYMYI